MSEAKTGSEAKMGDTVSVHYTGTFTDGEVFDSSRDREPLSFTLGESQVIPGFEDAVLGMQPGESKQTTIPANRAYGEHRDELVFTVGREELPADFEPVLDESYQMVQPDGQMIPLTVKSIAPESVTFDANHPLAGQDLNFDIQLVNIGQAA